MKDRLWHGALAVVTGAVLGCSGPPSHIADGGGVGGAAGGGGSGGGAGGGSGGDAPAGGDGGSDGAPSCPSVIAADPLAAGRATCHFTAGAAVTDTLPLTESRRAAIPIKHVIVAMKENRSFDHMLGHLSAAGQPAAEPLSPTFTNQDRSGATVGNYHLLTTCINKDPGHQWDEMHRGVDGGKMDGFVTSAADTTGSDGHFVMGYYDEADLPFYYWLANTFALNDRHFASARSGTFPNRNFELLGTADGVKCTGCGLPKATTPTIFDKLDAAHVTWGVYVDTVPMDGTLGWDSNHRGVHTFADFKKAAKDGTLPQVVFVDGTEFGQDEHPTADVQLGEAWTREVYQAVVGSSIWPTTAFIWTYDEGGGFADHVPPSNNACVARPEVPADAEFVELGVRVPFAVISPYARAHTVSHAAHDHTAITRFIETVFGLTALTSRDANSDALLDMFDFDCAPALLHPPEPPAAGTGGCRGNIVMATDREGYPSGDAMSITVTFSGASAPDAHDRIGVYKYGDLPPSASNKIEPVSWAYIGGQGHKAAGAPKSGSVVIDKSGKSSGAVWPLAAGLWIAYYLPAASGGDGYVPAASVDFDVTP